MNHRINQTLKKSYIPCELVERGDDIYAYWRLYDLDSVNAREGYQEEFIQFTQAFDPRFPNYFHLNLSQHYSPFIYRMMMRYLRNYEP